MDTATAAKSLRQYAHAACSAAAKARDLVHEVTETSGLPVKGFMHTVDLNLIERMIGADALAQVWVETYDELGRIAEADATALDPFTGQKDDEIIAAVRTRRHILTTLALRIPREYGAGVGTAADHHHRVAVAKFLSQTALVDDIEDEPVAEAAPQADQDAELAELEVERAEGTVTVNVRAPKDVDSFKGIMSTDVRYTFTWDERGWKLTAWTAKGLKMNADGTVGKRPGSIPARFGDWSDVADWSGEPGWMQRQAVRVMLLVTREHRPA